MAAVNVDTGERESLAVLTRAECLVATWFGSSVDLAAHGPAAQLQTTLNAIPAHTWYAVPSGGLTFVNQRCADYLGLSTDHPLRFGIDTGAAWDSHIPLLHPEDHEQTRRVWSECLRTGRPGEVSFRARNAEGNYRWFLSRAEPLRANDGTLLYWIGINLDIEERKQAEFYLAQGQRLAHTGSWSFTAAGFEHWSPELFAIHGLDPHNKPPSIPEYLELVHPDDRTFVAKEIRTMLAEHRGFDFTKRIVRPDGLIRHVRCVGVPAISDGTFHGFVGTGIDVTEGEELTRALRESEQELREILDLVPQLVGVLGPQAERLYANRVTLSYFGVTLDEWRQRDRRSEVHPDDAGRFKAAVDRSVSSSSPYELEVRLSDAAGGYRWFLARYNPVRDDNGQVRRWYVACTDIEDRKRAEERLQQENVALREEIDKTSMFEEIVGASPVLRQGGRHAGIHVWTLIPTSAGTASTPQNRGKDRSAPVPTRKSVWSPVRLEIPILSPNPGLGQRCVGPVV